MSDQPEQQPINGEPVLDAPVAIPPAQYHFLETLDGLANVAKAVGVYPNFINAVLQVASIVLSEIGEEHVDEVIGRLAAQAQLHRAAREAAMAVHQAANDSAAQSTNPTGAPNVH